MKISEQKCPFCHETFKGQLSLVSCENCGAIQHCGCWDETLNQCAACKYVRVGIPAPIRDLQEKLDNEEKNQFLLTVFIGWLLFFGVLSFVYGLWIPFVVESILALALYLIARQFRKEQNDMKGNLAALQERHEEILSQQIEEQTEETPCGKHPKKELA